MGIDEMFGIELLVDDDAAEVVVDGELDIVTAHLVEDQVAACAGRAGLRRISLDLRGVSFCDAAGLAALVRSRMCAVDHRLRYEVHPSGAVRRIADITGESLAAPG